MKIRGFHNIVFDFNRADLKNKGFRNWVMSEREYEKNG